jgi:hypothetical protein
MNGQPLNHLEGKHCYLALINGGFAAGRRGELHPALHMLNCADLDKGEPFVWNAAVALLYAHFNNQKQQVDAETRFNSMKQGPHETVDHFLLRAVDAARGISRDYVTLANAIRGMLQPGDGKYFLTSQTFSPDVFNSYDTFRSIILMEWTRQIREVTAAREKSEKEYPPLRNQPTKPPAGKSEEEKGGYRKQNKDREYERPEAVKGLCKKCGPNRMSRHTTENHKDDWVYEKDKDYDYVVKNKSEREEKEEKKSTNAAPTAAKEKDAAPQNAKDGNGGGRRK